MLFAIGGMFVTLGLTSLLRWAKLGEDDYLDSRFSRKARLLTDICAALFSVGINPSHLVDRIHVGPDAPNDRTSVTTPQLPLSVTLSELARCHSRQAKLNSHGENYFADIS